MSAKNKCQASVLIELMVAIMVMGLISPTLFQYIGLILTNAKQMVGNRQSSIERIDLNHRIHEDIMNTHSVTQDCCFSSLDFLICYDIKNGRVRRRKRKWTSQRFYTHYIGQKPHYTRVSCLGNEGLLTIEWISDLGESDEWVFVLGAQ